MAFTCENNISSESFYFFVFRDVLFGYLINIFGRKAEVDQKHLWFRIQASHGIDHHVLGLQIIESPLRTMHILEDAYQLLSNIKNFHNLLNSFI